jgi:predicted nucleic acid-binding protein
MRIYADTSWWLGYKCRRDVHHEKALRLFDLYPDAEVIWTPWHRLEVFNGLSQAERVGTLRKGESQNIIRLLEQEITFGYWPHVEFSWTESIRTAGEIRAEHSTTFNGAVHGPIPCRDCD